MEVGLATSLSSVALGHAPMMAAAAADMDASAPPLPPPLPPSHEAASAGDLSPAQEGRRRLLASSKSATGLDKAGAQSGLAGGQPPAASHRVGAGGQGGSGGGGGSNGGGGKDGAWGGSRLAPYLDLVDLRGCAGLSPPSLGAGGRASKLNVEGFKEPRPGLLRRLPPSLPVPPSALAGRD